MPDASAPVRVAIVGAGISGLATAHRLLASWPRDQAPPEVTLLEATARTGGVIRTEHVDGLVLDKGPDSFVATKPHAAKLARELGLGERLQPTRSSARKVYLFDGRALRPLPDGLFLGIPTNLGAFVRSGVVSPLGQLRMGLDFVLPKRRIEGDESIGAFVRRRLGREALTMVAEPLLGGIYAGDVEALSVRATFPQFVEYEEGHGSIIRGAVHMMRERARARAAAQAQGGASSSSAGSSPFLSLVGGMGELVAAVERSARERGARILLEHRVRGLARAEGGAAYKLELEHGAEGRAGVRTALVAEHVVVATPAWAASSLLADVSPVAALELAKLPYVSTATITLAYARADVPHALDAVGVIAPKTAGLRVLAATFINSKWGHRAPDDVALLRVFVGGARAPSVLAGSDEELVTLARQELEKLVGVRAAPRLARVERYPRSSVQPVVGHLARMARVAAALERTPGLYLAGPAVDGVGVPDCIRTGELIAEKILRARRA
jgi:oxygen-dependent protoporphyrinogen oxidase